jgi:ketosteroid isomerase-like protein
VSRANVDLVHAVIDAWNGGELGDVLALATDEIEWLEVEGRPETSTGREVRGADDVRSGMEELFETWQSYRLEPEEVQAVGADRVLAVLREVARGRASGAEVASRWGYLLTIRDGKLARVEAYRDPESAFEAAARPGG